MAFLNERCAAIVQRIGASSSDGYATFEAVLQAFLFEVNAPSLQHLGVSSLECLDRLWILHHKVNAYIATYLSLHTVVSLADIDEEVVAGLRMSGILPFIHTQIDANEIDISSDPSRCSTAFASYGVGALQSHPMLSSLFPYPITRQLTSNELLSSLVEHVDKHSLGVYMSDVNVSEFASFVCGKYGLLSLHHGGILVKSDLKEELALAKQVLNRKKRRISTFLGSEAGSAPCIQESASALPRRRRLVTPRMEPRSSLCRDLMQRCRAELNSEHSPSFSKLRAVVAQLLQPIDAEAVVTLCSEYVMLGLGSSKYREKQYECDVESEDAVVVEGAVGSAAGALPDASVTGSSAAHLHRRCSSDVAPSPEQPLELRLSSGLSVAHLEVCTDQLRSFAVPELLPPSSSTGTANLGSVGRWGEALVYQYLVHTLPSTAEVHWVNETTETLASYDILVKDRGTTTFIDVKSTRFDDKNAFSLSYTELEFITKHPRPHYDVYRVFNAGNRDRVRIVVLKDVFQLIESRKIMLCLAI